MRKNKPNIHIATHNIIQTLPTLEMLGEEIQFNKNVPSSAIMERRPFQSNIRIHNQFSFSISGYLSYSQIKSLRLLFTTKILVAFPPLAEK